MKHTIKNMTAKASLLLFGLLSGAYAMAQDASSTQTESNHSSASHSESTVAPDPTMWYSNPILWVVGGVVLLIIIILAVRSGGGTTVIRDGGVSRTTTTSVTKD